MPCYGTGALTVRLRTGQGRSAALGRRCDPGRPSRPCQPRKAPAGGRLCHHLEQPYQMDSQPREWFDLPG
ncbi:hypothetical protein PUN4_550203 [Paraburkholderia unamae]|nr:hypothetical protein PUN4_550203 [Paraburkholderia unamae]